MGHFVITRQHHLIDSVHSKSVQASTLLVTGIPARYLNQDALRRVFGSLPGGVKKIWINRQAIKAPHYDINLSLVRNLNHLPDVYDRRLQACNKLEAAETKLLRAAVKLRADQLKEAGELKRTFPFGRSRYGTLFTSYQRLRAIQFPVPLTNSGF